MSCRPQGLAGYDPTATARPGAGPAAVDGDTGTVGAPGCGAVDGPPTGFAAYARRALDPGAPVVRDELEGRTDNHIFDWEAGNAAETDAVFARVTDQIAEQDPEAALGWVTRQYEQLVGTCGAPDTATEAEVPADGGA